MSLVRLTVNCLLATSILAFIEYRSRIETQKEVAEDEALNPFCEIVGSRRALESSLNIKEWCRFYDSFWFIFSFQVIREDC